MSEVAVADPAKWPLVASLSDAWKVRLSTFRHLHNTLYFTTFDRRVFARGANHQGLLGVGHREPTDEPVELPELSNQDVIDFNGGVDFRVALTKLGRVYTWNGQDILRPRPLEGSPGAFASIECGAHYTAGITEDRRLYVWGDFNEQHLPTPTRVGSEDFQVGRILSTVPKLIVIEPDDVSLYECGPLKSIVFEVEGLNVEVTMVKFYFETNENTSAFVINYKSGSGKPRTVYVKSQTALNNSNNKTVFYTVEDETLLPLESQILNIEYGQLVEQCQDILLLVDAGKVIKIRRNESFVEVPGKSLADAVGEHSTYKISPSMLCLCKPEEQTTDRTKTFNLVNGEIVNSFDRPENADIVFKFGTFTIHAHRNFLSFISDYMHTLLSDKWLDQSVIEVTQHSYPIYYRYLLYLYTGQANVSNVQELFDLYHLANSYFETGLKQYCLEMLNDRLDIDTACQVFEFTIKYELQEFAEKVAQFVKTNLDSMDIQFVEKMNEHMARELLIQIIQTK